jgi:hypothetical protein
MLHLLLLFTAGYSINIPSPVSIKDMVNLTPDGSITNIIWNFTVHNRWVITGFIFFITLLAVLLIVARGSKESEETNQVPEEVIFFEGRKICLPQSEIMNGLEKYHLCEDFDEEILHNEDNYIYKDTLINQLKNPIYL